MKRTLSALVVAVLFVSSAIAADWPQWRGVKRDGISKETGLLQEWPEGGPPLRWTAKDIGTGYSTPSIVDGRVYLQTTRGEEEFATALNENNGDLVWSVPIGTVGVNRGPQYPGSRSTPTTDGELIYCLASGGELVCLEASSGELKWKRHLVEDFNGAAGNWAFAESVLIDGDVLVCTPGGDEATLVALNKLTGELIWKSPVPDIGTAEYASIMIQGAGKEKEYVQFLRKGVVGVNAETGELLWRYDATVDQGANILTPVVEGNLVFTSGSRTGGGVVELKEEGDGVTATQVYFDTALGASIGGAVLVDGYLYGTTSKVLFCADFKTGEIKWRERSVAPASICYADGRLYVRGHNEGEVALVEPSPEGYREKGRFAQPDRSEKKAWPHPVIANGCLYLRDENTLLCYDVRANQ